MLAATTRMMLVFVPDRSVARVIASSDRIADVPGARVAPGRSAVAAGGAEEIRAAGLRPVFQVR